MLSSTLIAPLEIAKVLFWLVYVAATVGVAVGVYWEGDQFPKAKQQRGWRLLVTSLAVDTLFTVLIFSVDGWISAIQREELSIVAKYVSPRDLSASEIRRLATNLAPLSGQTMALQSYAGDAEGYGLQLEIAAAFHFAGIDFKAGYWYPDTSPGIMLLSGMEVDAPPKDAAVAAALQKALEWTGLPIRPQWYPSATDSVVTLRIGVKPFSLPRVPDLGVR
jgi:hypothetical protein